MLLSELNLKYDEFIDLCILCGNDYVSKLKELDYKLAYKLIKKYKNIEEIQNKCNLIKFPKDYDYKTSRNIYKLNNIDINIYDIININTVKSPNIFNLKKFLQVNSTIDEKIYIHRIQKMYNSKKDLKINFAKSSYIPQGLKSQNIISKI